MLQKSFTVNGATYFVGDRVVVSGQQDYEEFDGDVGTIRGFDGKYLSTIGIEFDDKDDLHNLKYYTDDGPKTLLENNSVKGWWFSLENIEAGVVKIDYYSNPCDFDELFI